jgi:pimeloyl-ACP methyl ester carboxylesterase
MLENSQLIEKIAPKITAPTQLIWGEEDQVNTLKPSKFFLTLFTISNKESNVNIKVLIWLVYGF